MGFYGLSFIFDDIPSELFNIYIGSLNDSGESLSTGSQSVELLTQKLFRRPKLLYYGSEQIPQLEFSLSMYSPDEITAADYNLISAWLFGQQEYKILRICQNDMQTTHFHCFLTDPQVTRVGNLIQNIVCTVINDSPWAWTEDETNTYTYDPNAYTISDSISLLNKSANNFYTFPTSLIITTNTYGGIISITNTSDASRIFTLGTVTNPLLPNEVITMNCDLQIIASDLTTYPLIKFNQNWLRFLPGYNTLTVSGNVSSIKLTYPVAVKVA